jgi:hypothetical protein
MLISLRIVWSSHHTLVKQEVEQEVNWASSIHTQFKYIISDTQEPLYGLLMTQTGLTDFPYRSDRYVCRFSTLRVLIFFLSCIFTDEYVYLTIKHLALLESH